MVPLNTVSCDCRPEQLIQLGVYRRQKHHQPPIMLPDDTVNSTDDIGNGSDDNDRGCRHQRISNFSGDCSGGKRGRARKTRAVGASGVDTICWVSSAHTQRRAAGGQTV
jgi:hypothetical protein